MWSISLIILLICLSHIASIVNCIIIQTSSGPIRGKHNCFNGTKYYSFEGIPFAEPPIGDLRFRPPVPVTPWKNIRNATSPGSVCPQLDYFYPRSQMNEECLFINVYVPVTKSSNPLPVFFFVHGGYYSLGAGSPKPVNGPQLLLQKGFIVVIPNYRKGALGFLSLRTIGASGNAGLKDVLLALKWFNKNIANFKGDANSVCLGGVGAGGAMVHYLMLTEQSTGLFNSAISLAGSAISYRAIQYNPRCNALKLTRQLGIQCTNNRCMLKQLKEADVFAIVDAQEYLITNDPRRAFVLRDLFSPTVEKKSSIALITKDPLEIIRTEGLIQKVSLLTGFNDQEGLEMFSILKKEPNIIEKLNSNFELCIPPNIRYKAGSQKSIELANLIKQFYFNNLNISIYNTQNYINLITDTAYSYSIDFWINLYKSSSSSSAIYYYYFKFDGELNWAKLFEDVTYQGADHADELGYVFVTNVTVNKFQNIDSRTNFVLTEILNQIKNLVVYKNPTPQQYGGTKWIQTGTNGEHFELGDSAVNVAGRPIPERLQFWYKVYADYYEYERTSTSK